MESIYKMDNDYGLDWFDVPGYEGTYKAADVNGKLLLYNVKRQKPLKFSETYSMSQYGMQKVVTQKQLREWCNL